MASELKWSLFPGFTARASSALLRNKWPGNVRELKFAIERSVYRSASPDEPIRNIVLDAFDSPYKIAAPPKAAEGVAMSKRRAPLLPTDLKERLRETEIDLLTAALEKARFNQRLAAELLGLSYHQFRGKLRKFDLRSKPEPA